MGLSFNLDNSFNFTQEPPNAQSTNLRSFSVTARKRKKSNLLESFKDYDRSSCSFAPSRPQTAPPTLTTPRSNPYMPLEQHNNVLSNIQEVSEPSRSRNSISQTSNAAHLFGDSMPPLQISREITGLEDVSVQLGQLQASTKNMTESQLIWYSQLQAMVDKYSTTLLLSKAPQLSRELKVQYERELSELAITIKTVIKTQDIKRLESVSFKPTASAVCPTNNPLESELRNWDQIRSTCACGRPIACQVGFGCRFRENVPEVPPTCPCGQQPRCPPGFGCHFLTPPPVHSRIPNNHYQMRKHDLRMNNSMFLLVHHILHHKVTLSISLCARRSNRLERDLNSCYVVPVA